MSKQLTIAAALSVLMMTSFALLGTPAMQMSHGLGLNISLLHVASARVW